MIDRLLDAMEGDRRWAFTLDGQLATVDDYLEVRPEGVERIGALVREGRLAVGPWHVLMDEFLVSGESIVRNLELGLRRAEQLGGAMPVGYLPDQFGHVAQMPQILRRAGLEHAVVWRGVPAAINRHAFRWAAPDGSAIRAEYLPQGYGNAAHLLEIPDRLADRVERLHAAMRPFFGDDDVLAMYGTDHMEPAPDLVEVVEATNAAQDRYRLVLHTLADYFGQVSGSGPRTRLEWRGELRSAARANLLPGVVSARVDIKAACARAERLLERYAEPLQALWGESWPQPLLDLAWRRVIENSAHDSICGCSADAVSRQVLVRFDEAEQIAAGLARAAAEAVARETPPGSVAVLNPSPHARSDLVEVDLAIPDDWSEVALELPDGRLLATQELARPASLLIARELPGREIPTFLGRRLHGRELFGRCVNGFAIDRDAGLPRLTLHVSDRPDPPVLDMGALRSEIEVAPLANPDEVWLVRIEARPPRRAASSVPAPPLGWTAVRPVAGRGEIDGAVRAEGRRLLGGEVEVEVADDGTLRIGSLEGVARIVDGGDFGDSYNYAPPGVDTIVDRPDFVSVDVAAVGPLRAELVVRRGYRWPVGLTVDGAARAEETAPTALETRVELRAGEPFVRLRVSFENPSRDHRVRLHLPLPRPGSAAAAEGQFAVVERGPEPEGGFGEVPVPTFPARGFVDAGGLSVLLDQVLEYEVVGGSELALTLLRSTGLISRNQNPWREDPAGPEVEIPEAQLLGPRSVAFAVLPHDGSWLDARVLEHMERYQHPFLTGAGAGPAEASAATRSGLAVEGDGVVLSSLRRRDGQLELRLACERPDATAAIVTGEFREAREVDLLGRMVRPLELDPGTLRLDLGPWEIRTVQLL